MNYNVCISGIAGSGKRLLMQEMMLSTLGVSGKVFVLDCGKNFKNLCRELGGEYIEFDPSRQIAINPFSQVPTGDDNASCEARERLLRGFLFVLYSMVGKEEFSYDETSILQQAINSSFDNKAQETSIDDIANLLLEQKDNKVANALGSSLFDYTENGRYGAYFSKRCEIEYKDLMIVDLSMCDAALQKVLGQTMLLSNEIRSTLNGYGSSVDDLQKKLVVIEDSFFLKDPNSCGLIEGLVRVSRLNLESIVVATESLTDFHKYGEDAASIFEGASFKIIMQQKPGVIEEAREIPLFRDYIVSDEQMRNLNSIESKTGKYSEFALYSSNIHGDVQQLHLGPFTLLLMSTKQADKSAILEKREAGLSLTDAVNSILEERGVA